MGLAVNIEKGVPSNRPYTGKWLDNLSLEAGGKAYLISMKVTLHLTSKNVCGLMAGACVTVLAFIPLAVPPDHWLWMRWKVTVIGCSAAAVFALVYQAMAQSKEDVERQDKERDRDTALTALQKSLTSGPVQGASDASNAITRSVPHTPGTFNSVEFFRTAYYSSLQDVGANSYITEAEQVRPNNKESFYLDVLAVGTIQMMYDNLWWISYRSQIRALTALNAAQGMLPIDEFRKSFDQAATEFADDYARLKITFENWVKFMLENDLLKLHPSRMVEITLKGKDFLKYLLHHGRSVETDKRL